MEVLLCLARAGGEVVDREYLFAKVWRGAAVSDDTLTQSIAELRRAFGESARDPQVIETIPKRGFRLILPVQEAGGERTAKGWRWGTALAVVLIVAIVGTLLARGRTPENVRSDPVVSTASIAVLPFADLSQAGDQQYFADGLADELIMQLSQLDGLLVTARTSAFQFRSSQRNLAEIGGVLGVQHILEGSVRKSGQSLRVSARLVDVDSGFPLWSEQFDEELSDVFTIQEHIAEAVATAIGIKLSIGYFAREQGGTDSIEAFDQFLLAREQKTKDSDSEAALARTVEHLQLALGYDPEFAGAWMMLSDVYAIWMPLTLGRSNEAQWRPMADEARQRAIAIAPDAPFVRSAVAYQAIMRSDFLHAQQTLESSSSENPLMHAGVQIDLFLKTGKVAEARELLELQRRVDPMSRAPHHYFAHMMHMEGDYLAALGELEKEFEYDDRQSLSTSEAIIIALSTDDPTVHDKWLERAVAHQLPADYGGHSKVAAWHNDPEKMRQWLHDAFDRRLLEDYWIAVWAGLFGDPDLSLAAMQRTPDAWAFWIPALSDVRASPGFRELMREIGMVEYWETYGWGEFCRPVDAETFECI